MRKKVCEVDKNGMSDFIFSFPTSFFAPPPLCSKEKVAQKQHLRMTYTSVYFTAFRIFVSVYILKFSTEVPVLMKFR